jgi:hypothetical protein
MGCRPFGRTGTPDLGLVCRPEIGPQQRGLLRTSCATCLQGSRLIPFPTGFVLRRALWVNEV